MILNLRMDVVSLGRSDQLSVPQYHFKMLFIAFRLLVLRKFHHTPMVPWFPGINLR